MTHGNTLHLVYTTDKVAPYLFYAKTHLCYTYLSVQTPPKKGNPVWVSPELWKAAPNMYNPDLKEFTASRSHGWILLACTTERPVKVRWKRKEVFHSARVSLSQAISQERDNYAKRIHIRIQNTKDKRHIWKGIQASTDYKGRLHVYEGKDSLTISKHGARYKTMCYKGGPPNYHWPSTLSGEDVR